MSKNPSTKRIGRPSSFTPELAARICQTIANGKSLRSVCLEEGVPPLGTVMRWLNENEAFREQYARATEQRADLLAEEILEIADDGRNDYTATENGETFNSEHVQRSRLRVDARKWLLAKMQPKKYGDRVQTEVTGPDGGAVVHKVTVELVGTARSDS